MYKRKWWPRHLLLMPAVFLFGIVLFFLSHALMHGDVRTDWSLLRDIGIAFMIAAILAITVDQAIRGQLVEDVFKASIGYILPPELKGEMEWIYSTHILCVDHDQTCELSRVDNDTCLFQIKMFRKFRNISSSKASLSIGGSNNEWCYQAGTSKIVSLGYTKSGTQHKIEKKESGIGSVKEYAMSLAPGEETTIWYEAEEITRSTDERCWVFSCPTLNPTVTMKVFGGISTAVYYGYRSPAEQLGIWTFRLKGTLLPGQVITVRWWDTSKSEGCK